MQPVKGHFLSLEDYLRSTMKQARLYHTMVLHIYKDMVDALDLNSVGDDFVQASEYRLTILESSIS